MPKIEKKSVTLKPVPKKDNFWQISKVTPAKFKTDIFIKTPFNLYNYLFPYLAKKLLDADEIVITAKYKTKDKG